MKLSKVLPLVLLLLSTSAWADVISYTAIARFLRPVIDAEAATRISRLDWFKNPELEENLQALFEKHRISRSSFGISNASAESKQALLADVQARFLFAPNREFVQFLRPIETAAGAEAEFLASGSSQRVRFVDTEANDSWFLHQVQDMKYARTRVQVTYRTATGQRTRSTGQIGRTTNELSPNQGFELHPDQGATLEIGVKNVESVQPLQDLRRFSRIERHPLEAYKNKNVRITYEDSATGETLQAEGRFMWAYTRHARETIIQVAWHDATSGEDRSVDVALNYVMQLKLLLP